MKFVLSVLDFATDLLKEENNLVFNSIFTIYHSLKGVTVLYQSLTKINSETNASILYDDKFSCFAL